ncbi:telomerase Cajal body protein 1-like isoform X7 [Dreissena polymorpha]|uniref:telomerase Cajal body protein 1-like isoform X7 n=1 Tax=Dreissena polymorpha TaxID=45954 RepID=UPI0022640862|nr:telomerase Cajal body protein 1-like isoform X7 [Dreissena polymorpha]
MTQKMEKTNNENIDTFYPILNEARIEEHAIISSASTQGSDVVTELNTCGPLFSSNKNELTQHNTCLHDQMNDENNANNDNHQIEFQTENGNHKDKVCQNLLNMCASPLENKIEEKDILVYSANMPFSHSHTLQKCNQTLSPSEQLHTHIIPPSISTKNQENMTHHSLQSMEESWLKKDCVAQTSESNDLSIKITFDDKDSTNSEHTEEVQEPQAKRPKLDFDSSTICDPPDVLIIKSHGSSALSKQFSSEPCQITGAWECFENEKINNYLRGCKWAPDGTCLIVNSNDNTLRVFNLPQELYYDGGEYKVIPELAPVFSIKESDTVYDFAWFPLMSSAEPDTACVAVTSKDTPIHLYDAFTGTLRCSYRAYNHVDEVVAAHSVEFSCDGLKLYSGFNKMIRVFDVTRPGREFTNRPTFAKDGQRGIISCISPSPTEPGIYAAGSYAKSIALYHEPMGEMVCMFEGQQGGVTQVKFSPDGTKLYSGGRKDNEILCWDMRQPGQILFTLNRLVTTNQRMYFDLTSNSRYIVSGSHDGTVIVWDSLATPVTDGIHSEPVIHPAMKFQAHYDTVNGVSVHKTLPLVATTSGQRHFKCVLEDSDDDEGSSSNNTRANAAERDNCVRLWWT